MILAKLQKLGKALMLPIAVLPIAGILLRIGQPDVLNIPFIANAGDAIFKNLSILFGIGIAVGLAEDNDGAAGLAGAVANFIFIAAASTIVSAKYPDLKFDIGVLSGIIGGITAGILYNKFHAIKVPEFLGFFGGRRFVPIITGLFALVEGAIMGFIYPGFDKVFVTMGNWITGSGAVGAFIFGILNRLLLPTGLHHILNNLVWQVFGAYDGKTGDLNRFFAGDPNAGQFMTGFFPVMMFGVLGAALAMYVSAKKHRRPEVGGMLLSVALTSFLTGITEPFEFLFMFLSPVLYLIHALLTGISLSLTYALGMRDGFSFSAGFIDYFLNYGIATKPIALAVFGVAYFFIYFGIFYFMIKVFNLKTPGREENDITSEKTSDMGITEETAKYVEVLGGIDNIKSIDSCITRLRLTVGDSTQIEDSKIMALGARGVIRPSKEVIQIVLGQKAEKLADELKKLK